jgi:hypothetical protein
VVLGVGVGSFATPLDLALASGQAFQRVHLRSRSERP